MYVLLSLTFGTFSLVLCALLAIDLRCKCCYVKAVVWVMIILRRNKKTNRTIGGHHNDFQTPIGLHESLRASVYCTYDKYILTEV